MICSNNPLPIDANSKMICTRVYHGIPQGDKIVPRQNHPAPKIFFLSVQDTEIDIFHKLKRINHQNDLT